MKIELISEHRCFDGIQFVYKHESNITQSSMRFGLYLPPKAQEVSVPALMWLSGLTCTEENFIVKAGAQRLASQLGIAILVPDTSPRVSLVGDKENYAFGQGASFYLDATEVPWDAHYKMYSYLSQEIPALMAHFPIDINKVGVFGHSMGGHGALMVALKHPDFFKSVSAFAPIASLMQSPWGVNALQKYLGKDKTAWVDYDVARLIVMQGFKGRQILIDQGTADPYLTEQLQPTLLQEACQQAGIPLNLRMQQGYDHSYFFVATFMEDHMHFHANQLGLNVIK